MTATRSVGPQVRSAWRGTLSTTRGQGWQNRNLGIYDNYKISLFSVSARAVRATPTQTKLMPAASTCLPTTSVQSSRATRPQMHPALRPRHLARHRMSPCSHTFSCKMNPATSPDTPSTNSIHRDCQSDHKIVPPAERAHRHLNDPRTSTTSYWPKRAIKVSRQSWSSTSLLQFKPRLKIRPTHQAAPAGATARTAISIAWMRMVCGCPLLLTRCDDS